MPYGKDHVLNLETGVVRVQSRGRAIQHGMSTPDGKYVLYCDDDSLELRLLESQKTLWAISPGGSRSQIAMSADGRRAAKIGSYRAFVHELPSGKQLLRVEVKVPNRDVMSGGFSPDGRLFAVGNNDYVACMDVDSGQVLCHVEVEPGELQRRLTFVLFSPDHQTLTLVHATGMVRQWRIPAARGSTMPVTTQPSIPGSPGEKGRDRAVPSSPSSQ